MGASSYIVASDNLGDRAGIMARLGAAHRLHGDRGGLGLGRRAAMTSIIPQLDGYRVSSAWRWSRC